MSSSRLMMVDFSPCLRVFFLLTPPKKRRHTTTTEKKKEKKEMYARRLLAFLSDLLFCGARRDTGHSDYCPHGCVYSGNLDALYCSEYRRFCDRCVA